MKKHPSLYGRVIEGIMHRPCLKAYLIDSTPPKSDIILSVRNAYFSESCTVVSTVPIESTTSKDRSFRVDPG